MGLLTLLRRKGASGAVTPFAPTDMAALKLWLKADSLSLNDADPVTTWADSSGLGNDVGQATAALKPLYKVNIVNGKPVVRYDGADDKLGSASVVGTTFFAASAATIWLVYNQPTAGTLARPISWGTNEVTNAVELLGHFSDNSFYFDYGDETANAARISAAKPAGWNTGFHIVELYRSGVTMTITIDGTVLVTSGAISDDLDPTVSAVLYIGASPIGTSTNAIDMAEVVISNAAESAGNRTNMKNYLASKYAITVA